ncbi:MAG: hypothetical protein DCF26_03785 [Burkholderiales bacterium]|nr:MAG: hypothetical protein DCF26_03785 [Burkholderiales bacterium]
MAATRPRQRFVHGLPQLLPLLPALVALVLMGLVMFATDHIVGRALEQRAEYRVEQVAQSYADQIGKMLARRAAELELLGTLSNTGLPPDALRREMERLKTASSAYVWIGSLDRDGRVEVGTSGLLEGESIADNPVFINGRQGLWLGRPHPPLMLKTPLEQANLAVPDRVADVALPRVSHDGAARGVMAAHIDAAYFDQLRRDVLGPVHAQRGLQLALVDEQGAVLLGGLKDASGEGWRSVMSARPDTGVVSTGNDGRQHMLSRTRVVPTDSRLHIGWQVVASQPLEAALLPVAQLERMVQWLGVATTLVIGLAGFWFSRRLARPYSQALAKMLHDTSRLQAVLQNLPAPVYLVDDDFRVVFWNLACETVFGWTAAEAQGRHVNEILPSASGAQERDGIRAEVVAGRGPWQFEGHMLRRDGSEMWGEWRLIKVLGADGRSFGVMAQVNDLTAERRVREQGEVFEAVIKSASDAVISVDVDGRISLFNPAAERIFGHAADTMIGQNLDILVPDAERHHHRGYMQRFAESPVTTLPLAVGHVRGLRADGQLLELEASISQVMVRGQKLLTAILRDVSERRRAEQAMVQYRKELSALAQRLLDQEKNTTQRMAQTLHDQLGQTLSAIRFSYDAFSPRAIEQLEPAQQERLRSIGQLIEQAVLEVRQALVELRPPLLQEMGLQAALDNEVRVRSIEAESVVITLEVSPDAEGLRWPGEVEYAAFMIAREATGNALLHACASSIELHLQGSADELRLWVSDDGIGLHDSLSFGRPGHLGIVGMRERAVAVGGRLTVKASPSGGTLISLVWATVSATVPTG